MNLGYIASNICKNALAPIILPLARRRGSLGMDGDLDAVCAALQGMVPGIEALGLDVRDRHVLELGAGRTPDIAIAFALLGARRVTSLDTRVQVPDDWRSSDRQGALERELRDGRLVPLRAALGVEAAHVGGAGTLGELPVTFAAYAGDRLPLPDESVDLVVSKSVMEHVGADAVGALAADMRRVLRPGGGMVHLIDLRDHMRIADDDVVGDWLDALRYPEPLFRAMFNRRSTSINRLRSCEWRELLSRDGWDIRMWSERRYPFGAGFDREDLAARWRQLSPDELAIGQIAVAIAAPKDETDSAP